MIMSVLARLLYIKPRDTLHKVQEHVLNINRKSKSTVTKLLIRHDKRGSKVPLGTRGSDLMLPQWVNKILHKHDKIE